MSIENTDNKTSWFTCIGLIVLFLIPYSIVNNLPLNRITIPFVFGEKFIPFLPWTFIIYISAFIQSAIVIRRMPKLLLRKVVIVLGGALVLGLLTFIAFPIEFPRRLYWSDNIVVSYFRSTDAPGNCFPSLHVLMTLVFAFCYNWIERSIVRRRLMWVWTVLIIVSILTTKQHYLIDLFGGVALAVIAIVVIKKSSK